MRRVAAAVLLLAAVPATAIQVPGSVGQRHGSPMFVGMSDTGRAIMRTALRAGDPGGSHAATAAARDRMLNVLDADRLDVGALKRAMDDERETANAAKIRHQAALIAGLQQLSLADRRIFVANARAVRERFEERLDGGRGPGPGGPPPQ